MNLSTRLRPLAVLATLAVAGALAAHAEETTNTAKFSDPSKPGTFKVVMAVGDLRITGADTKEVVVVSEAQPQRRVRKDGLRVLTESATYELSEKDNVITLNGGADGWVGRAADFKITVPRGTNVVVSNSMGGDITCASIGGDIEIKSLGGEVKLTDVVGSAVVDTMNGQISATIQELREGKALSFTSMNGEVALRLPANAKANVRLRTQNGTILTDFDDKALVTKVENMEGGMRSHRGRMVFTPEVREAFREAARATSVAAQHAAAAVREAAEAAREGAEQELNDPESKTKHPGPAAPVPPVPPVLPSIPTVTGGKLVSGSLNGGGAEINVTTMNGDVIVRKIDSK